MMAKPSSSSSCSPHRNNAVQVLYFMAALVVAAAVLRLNWVENQAAGEACRSATTALCSFRQVLVLAFHYQVFGWASVLAGVMALGRPTRWLAAAALWLGGLALVFYTADLGAAAVVMGLVALARQTSRSATGSAPEQGCGRS